MRQYAITMGIRTACFILMFVIQPLGWWTWVLGIAAAVLPYIAVVFANAGDDSVPTAVESPRIGIEAPHAAEEQRPETTSPQATTLAETPARPAEPRS